MRIKKSKKQREKKVNYFTQEFSIRLLADFLLELLDARKQWAKVFKAVLKSCQ